MKRCSRAHDYEDGTAGPVNWLDWQAPDDKCPKCGGPLDWFKPAPLGELLDVVIPVTKQKDV